jgi:hypothetical protein
LACYNAQAANKDEADAPVKGELSPDLDGSLCREDQNIVVVSESKAETHNCRLADARERLEQRHSNALAVQVSAAPKDGVPAQEPLPTKPASWWARFIFGGGLIPKADASLALRLVLGELRIPFDERALDFQTEQVAKSTFCQVLEKLTGSDLGWRQLCQIYEREQARERLWVDH